jgi:Ala-tRNA(Pro) deacylase
MIDTIVRYLHGAHVPFRMSSYPSLEDVPVAAHPLPSGGVLVESRVVTVGQRPLLACVRWGERIDYFALGRALGGAAAEGATEELPGEFRYATGPVPPLGQLFGLPVVLDARASHADVLVFRSFAESVYFEIPYADYALLEQPRVASFAGVGDLVLMH